jgi:hypothetical protein
MPDQQDGVVVSCGSCCLPGAAGLTCRINGEISVVATWEPELQVLSCLVPKVTHGQTWKGIFAPSGVTCTVAPQRPALRLNTRHGFIASVKQLLLYPSLACSGLHALMLLLLHVWPVRQQSEAYGLCLAACALHNAASRAGA